MTGPQVPGWPGDGAARDGVPLDLGSGGSDPRLIAAERVIRQLRQVIGALTLQSATEGIPGDGERADPGDDPADDPADDPVEDRGDAGGGEDPTGGADTGPDRGADRGADRGDRPISDEHGPWRARLSWEQVHDPRAGRVVIRTGPHGVELTVVPLPQEPAATHATSPTPHGSHEPAEDTGVEDHTVSRAGQTPLMRKLARLADQHNAGSDSPTTDLPTTTPPDPRDRPGRTAPGAPGGPGGP